MKPFRRGAIRRRLRHVGLLLVGLTFSTHCGNRVPHNGRIPFAWMEKSPARPNGEASRMKRVLVHDDHRSRPTEAQLDRIRAGDVIAFTMSHRQAWKHLRQGTIQKIPYEILRYGHVALAVPDPQHGGELRLLQIAMKQPANTSDGLDYLRDKTWRVYRPPEGSVEPERLREFASQVTLTAADPERAYDYPGVFGWRNAPWQPVSEEEIGQRYSCATLVVAGLHYAGFELDAVHRGGRLDIVTPRQVVESYGLRRYE